MKPTSNVRTFATDATWTAPGDAWDGAPTRVNPTATAAQGYQPGEVPPADEVNYLFGNHGDWIAWLEAQADARRFEALTSFELQTESPRAVAHGRVYAFGTSNVKHASRASRAAISWTTGGAYTGGETAPVDAATRPSDGLTLCVGGSTKSYVVGASLSGGVSLGTAQAGSMIEWSPNFTGGGRFIAAVVGSLYSSAAGASWTREIEVTTGTVQNLRVAGSTLVALYDYNSGLTVKVSVSTDGGDTWTHLSTGIGSPDPTGLAYDASRGLWLISNGDAIYTATDPAGTWSLADGALPSALTWIDLFALETGEWISYTGDANGKWLHVSRDAGLTWETFQVSTSGAGETTRIKLIDGRIAVGKIITGRVA